MSRTTDWVLELEEAGLIEHDGNTYQEIMPGVMMFQMVTPEEVQDEPDNTQLNNTED